MKNDILMVSKWFFIDLGFNKNNIICKVWVFYF